LEKSERIAAAVQADEIIVTMSQTSYAVTYYKPANSPSASGKAHGRKGRLAHGHEAV
jgi:hypothetical protein